ncbi:MAG: hypothetical protein O3A01_05220, partial [bacterium]|nr:hypothetical protein [bacterium]
ITTLSELKGRVYRSLNNWLFFDTFHGVTDSKLEDTARIIERHNLKFLYGYTAAILNLARFLNKGNHQLHVQSIFTTTEVLPLEWRDEIERAFQCKVFDFAQVCDGGFAMFQCSHGCTHISEDLCYVLPPKSENPMQEVIVTGLHNRAMPFINYTNGDLYEVSQGKHEHCSIPFKTIRRLVGRVFEYFPLPNGEKIHGAYFGDTFREFSFVQNYQIIQVDLGHLVILLVPNDSSNEKDKFLESLCKIRARYPDTHIELRLTNELYKSKSGKTLPYIPLERYKQLSFQLDNWLKREFKS